MDPLERLAADPRVRIRRPGPPDPEGRVVLLWVQRAQRASDNAALDTAIGLGNLLSLPVVAYFGLATSYPGANLRHYRFMIDGLPDLSRLLERRGVRLVIRAAERPDPVRFSREVAAAIVVGDENPLRVPERWREDASRELSVPFWTVEADLVVPSALIGKEQFGARTIRPRIHRQLAWALAPTPEPSARVEWPQGRSVESLRPGPGLIDLVRTDRRVEPVEGPAPGPAAAGRHLSRFVATRLRGYAESRNHPELDLTSRLSPYLHFGHLGPREVARAVEAAGAPALDRQAFLEQFIVRRELAVNFVRFNPRYDAIEGCEPWARATLDRHRADHREFLYTRSQLEQAETHDPLWNAAERQMVVTGWMHGYLRMYWAKKILEWTRSPEEAMETAVALNDAYELDGRDPNGYAGIAWAIGGKHDRAWGPERPVFGTIRYMSLASTSRKFDSRRYIELHSQSRPGRSPVP